MCHGVRVRVRIRFGERVLGLVRISLVKLGFVEVIYGKVELSQGYSVRLGLVPERYDIKLVR